MTKSKKEDAIAEQEEEEEDKSNGLEIISIGRLYSGSNWDKKYWSSSRGKDRFPYPVGYQARRAYNGSSYKMEIQEGPKGPLFLITSADGISCSGQTPDIAWEKFQKKGCLRSKIWHGKRFSCRIDGIEFFGFRNPLVQRLLRELVANANGIAEPSLLPFSFCKGASTMDPNNQYQDPSTSSDILSYLARPHVTGKRSKRHEIINPNSSKIDGFKRKRAGDSAQGIHKERSPLPASTSRFDEMHDSDILVGEELARVQSNSATKNKNFHSSAKYGALLKSVDYPNHLGEKNVLVHEQSNLASSENNESTIVFSNSCAEEKPLDRLQDTEVKESNFPASSKLKAVDAPCREESQRDHDVDLCVPDTELEGLNVLAEESQSVHDVHLCAPDTLDLVQDSSTNSGTCTLDEIVCEVKEELMVNDLVVAEQLENKLHVEKEPGTCNSNVSSEKSDFDSVGQDIAKSMMTLLLPQVIPLLRKTSKKKKKTISPSENFPSTSEPHEKKNEIGSLMKAQSPDVDYSVVLSSENIKSVVPDEFVSDHCQDHAMSQQILSSNNVEANQLNFGKDAYCPNGGEQSDIEKKESSDIHVETTRSRDVLSHNKVQFNVSKMPQDGDLDSCMSASKKVPTMVNQNVWKHLGDNSSGADINSEEKNLESVPSFNEDKIDAKFQPSQITIFSCAASLEAFGNSLDLSRKDTFVKTGASEIGNISGSQGPKKVYTRRKVPNTELTVEKQNSPLLRSVGCQKLADGCISETVGTSLDSEPFNDKMEVVYADTVVGGELHDLLTDSGKTAITSKPATECRESIISVNQANYCASEGQDSSNLVVPSMLHTEKPQVHFEESLVALKDTLDDNGPGSQEEGTGFRHSKISSATEGNSGIMRHRNLELNNELESIVDFLGCYFHPLPVLSILLSRKGNEIYICALCGLLEEKDRTLFLYKLVIEGPTRGCPCFLGHTPVTWPSSTDIFGREIAFERSGLQLTPDGQRLLLLGNTKTSCCSEGRLDCLCSACALDSSEHNGVKIVQVKAGYVSVMVKLKTTDSLQCILVCEPDHLVAAGENRRLHVWTMNPIWSAPTEEFSILSNDYMSPCIMELKRIPKCSLVIGHDGFGEFTLWDISKRVFVSKFSAPSNRVHQFCPISLFGWQREVQGFSNSNLEAHVNRLVDATKMWISEHNMNRSHPPLENEDIAIWFLVSTVPDSDALHDHCSSDLQINPVGCWRLALLMKNTLMLGSALDPRAIVIGASAGHGIIGTLDGLVYMWEFLTGKKLGILHKFKGGSASCIATDNSGSGVVAVADDKGQLLVYLCSQ